jgi:hypothetical protein
MERVSVSARARMRESKVEGEGEGEGGWVEYLSKLPAAPMV